MLTKTSLCKEISEFFAAWGTVRPICQSFALLGWFWPRSCGSHWLTRSAVFRRWSTSVWSLSAVGFGLFRTSLFAEQTNSQERCDCCFLLFIIIQYRAGHIGRSSKIQTRITHSLGWDDASGLIDYVWRCRLKHIDLQSLWLTGICTLYSWC